MANYVWVFFLNKIISTAKAQKLQQTLTTQTHHAQQLKQQQRLRRTRNKTYTAKRATIPTQSHHSASREK